jgi:hypothetical protein
MSDILGEAVPVSIAGATLFVRTAGRCGEGITRMSGPARKMHSEQVTIRDICNTVRCVVAARSEFEQKNKIILLSLGVNDSPQSSLHVFCLPLGKRFS